MDLGLADKVALVTGSSRGLGFACAAALVEEGCRITVCARGEAKLAEAVSDLSLLPNVQYRVLPVVADVSTPEGVHRVVAECVGRFGGLYILVNNVGAAGGAVIVDTSDNDWQRTFDQTLFPAV